MNEALKTATKCTFLIRLINNNSRNNTLFAFRQSLSCLFSFDCIHDHQCTKSQVQFLWCLKNRRVNASTVLTNMKNAFLQIILIKQKLKVLQLLIKIDLLKQKTSVDTRTRTLKAERPSASFREPNHKSQMLGW